MNITGWVYIIIGGTTALIGLLTLVYTLSVSRKNATIETLTEKNEWLQEQLDQAKATSPDVLVKALSERRAVMEDELQRLLKDRDYNQAEVKALQSKIDHTRGIQKELQAVVEEYQRRYENLKRKVDVCPHCEAGLVELRDVHEEDWTGSYRQYDCGHVMVDGDPVVICPLDPAYPPFDKLELKTKYDENRKRWSCFYDENAIQTWHLPMTVAHGKTEREAKYRMQLIHEGRVETEEARTPTETPF